MDQPSGPLERAEKSTAGILQHLEPGIQLAEPQSWGEVKRGLSPTFRIHSATGHHAVRWYHRYFQRELFGNGK